MRLHRQHDLSHVQKHREWKANQMERRQMSTDAVIGGGIMGNFISLCCSGFSKGTMMSMHFFFL